VALELPLFPEDRAIHDAREGGRCGAVELDGVDALFLRKSTRDPLLGAADLPRDDGLAWGEGYEAYRSRVAAEAECFQFRYGWLESLGLPVVNPPLAQEIHRTKTAQLFTLMRHGFRVPPTIVGNDPDECREFVDAMGGEDRVVLKPLAGVYKTRLLSEIGLAAALDEGPVMLQRYIAGETIRAYLVDGTLVGAGRIVSRGGAVDSSVDQVGVDPVELPAESVRAGWAAARHLGLFWTGMDLIREATTAEYWILELNASAMFAAFSRQTGFDVPGALAELLIRLAQRESC
jgi:glutathione synthase/RimK-type ligase-like ATP-grasp enzyme